MDADAVVVGAGLAGLVATEELADAARKVVLVEQEPEQSFGGQAGALRRFRLRREAQLRMNEPVGDALIARAARRCRGDRLSRVVKPHRLLDPKADPLIAEVTGFGCGGMHGYNALEGTFLGGCLFSGRVAGLAAATAG